MKVKRKRWIAAGVLIAYSAVLIRFLVFKAIPTVHIGHLILMFGGPYVTGPGNFTPFKTIWPLLKGRNHLMAMANLLGNVVSFMPVGFLAPFVYRRMTWKWSLVLAVAVGLSMETMEVVFQVGIFDVDDIMLNAFGVLIGYGVFKIFNRRVQGQSRF